VVVLDVGLVVLDVGLVVLDVWSFELVEVDLVEVVAAVEA